jgi:hypothetical protein
MGNAPERHFCRRCGASLAEAVTVRTPWWRRLFPARQAPLAGDRRATPPGPGGGGAVGRGFLLVAMAAVVVAAVLAYAAVPAVHDSVNVRLDTATTALRRQIDPSYLPVRPTEVRATSQIAGHPAQLAADLVSNDYWAADTARDAQPTLGFKFDGPTDLDDLLVTPAPSPDFAKLARPRTIDVVYSDGTAQELTVKDDPKPQSVQLYARHVSSVSMKIANVYPTSQSTAVAIAEVEFYRLR